MVNRRVLDGTTGLDSFDKTLFGHVVPTFDGVKFQDVMVVGG